MRNPLTQHSGKFLLLAAAGWGAAGSMAHAQTSPAIGGWSLSFDALAARTCSLTVGQSLVAGGGGCVGSSVDMPASPAGFGQSPLAALAPTVMAAGMDDIGGFGAVQISIGGPRSLALSSISGAAAGPPASQLIATAPAARPMYRGTSGSAPDLLWGGNQAGGLPTASMVTSASSVAQAFNGPVNSAVLNTNSSVNGGAISGGFALALPLNSMTFSSSAKAPEPAALAVLATGLGGLALSRRRRTGQDRGSEIR